MKITRFVLVFIVLTLVITSCNSQKSITTSNVKSELSKDQKQQYYYVFLEANRKKLLGDLNGALALYYQCLEINPTSDVAMAEIASINELSKNYDVSIKYLKNAITINKDNKWYQINLAKLYVIKNDFQNAINIYEQLNTNYSDDLEITYNLAALYIRTKNYKKAIGLYDKIENKVGLRENLSLAKQQIYLQIGNKTKAYNEINELIKHYPNEAKYYGLLAEMFTNDNLFLQAKQNYDKLFELDSTNIIGQFSIIDFYRKKMDYDNAFKVINKVIINTEIPFNQKAIMFSALLNNSNEFNIYNEQIKTSILLLKSKYPKEKDSYTLYADFLIKKGLIKEAQTEIEYVVNKFSGNITLWEQLLSIYSYNNDINNLYDKSVIAIDSFPEHALFYLFRGISANRLGNNDEAVQILKAGLKKLENDEKLELDFYTNLGEAYHEIGNYKQSDYYFNIVLKKDPENLYVINNYSYYLSLREEKLEYAESISKKTIEAEPNNNTYLDTYAWILFKLKRYDDALVFIKRSIENGGIDSDVIVEHYGDITYKSGEEKKALEYWILSKEMGNTSEDLSLKIKNKKIK